jgi:hypothetical protein
MDKNYQTRNGQKVKIYSLEGNLDNKIHGAFLSHGKWRALQWHKDGKFYIDLNDGLDLVETKERQKIECWVNVYDDRTVAVHLSKERADINRNTKNAICFACVKITIDCEKGEGL